MRRRHGPPCSLRGDPPDTGACDRTVGSVTDRRRPARFAADEDTFGRLDAAEFTSAAGLLANQRAELAAAMLQHQVALEATEVLAGRSLEVADLARAARTDVDHLRRKLRGQVRASLEDLLCWTDILGLGTLSGFAVAAHAASVDDHVEGDFKRHLGRFLTVGNPFLHRAFVDWWAAAAPTEVLEPFAGADGIPALLREAGFDATFHSFDIEPLAPTVARADTLAEFPAGHRVVVTNPPYLSRHFARRKGLDVDDLPWGRHNNLYKVAVEECLEHCEWVAAIIPESFVTSGLFTERLVAVVSLTTEMFTDTEMPTCLALWGPEPTGDFTLWRGHELLGGFLDLSAEVPMGSCEDRIRFNVASGNVGLVAIDSTAGPSIRFCDPAEIPLEKVKHSARLVSRIAVDELDPSSVGAVIAEANRVLGQWRARTADVHLTAFKGLRADGWFRRRLDFGIARRILSTAVDIVEGTVVPSAGPVTDDTLRLFPVPTGVSGA